MNKTFFTAETFQLTALAMGDDGKTPAANRAFTMTAYTGRPVTLGGGARFCFDLAGLKLPGDQIPVLYSHDHGKIAGYANMVYKAASGLEAAGALFVRYPDGSVNPHGTLIANNADAGFRWQCSIGAQMNAEPEYLGAQAKARVNGFEVSGPAYVARDWTVSEISFCALGADSQTSAAILSEAGIFKGEVMNTELAEKLAALEEKLKAADSALVAANLETLEARHGFKLSANLKGELSQNFSPSQIKYCFSLAEELAAALKAAQPEKEAEPEKKAELGLTDKARLELLQKARPDLFKKDAANDKDDNSETKTTHELIALAALKAARKTAETYKLSAASPGGAK